MFVTYGCGLMIFRSFFVLMMMFGVALVAAPFVAFAQEAGQGEHDVVQEEAENRVKAADKVRAQVEDLAKDLKENERGHFLAIYNAHNLIQVVKIVQGDVGDAVKACGAENPDLKAGLEARYGDWKAAVDPILKEAEGNVDNMIAVQDYAKSRDIRQVLKTADKVRQETNQAVEKVPVTSVEACNYLRDKMDDTQDNLTKLLQSTLVSLPIALQQAPDDEE